MIRRVPALPSSTLPDEARIALAARFEPVAGRFAGTSPTAALLFLFDRAREGDGEARRLALAALRRTEGDEAPPRQAAAEAAVHAEAVQVAPDNGLEKTTRAAIDAALAAFGWSGAPTDSGRADDGDEVGTEAHGLMIATLAQASLTLSAPGYRETASRAGQRALDRRVDDKWGTLLHLTGGRQQPAGLEDYSLLIRGLLELLHATGERGWLHEAVRLQGEQEERLWDVREGGYFELPEGAGRTARKVGSDGAFLSGNGVAALNLIDLSCLTSERGYRDRAEAVLRTFAAEMAKAPLAHLGLLRAAQRFDRTSPSA